jgi:monofunctional biosynthetic peptidoglycan transglycosylase
MLFSIYNFRFTIEQKKKKKQTGADVCFFSIKNQKSKIASPFGSPPNEFVTSPGTNALGLDMRIPTLLLLAVLAGCGLQVVVDPPPAPDGGSTSKPAASRPATMPASAPAADASKMVIDFKKPASVEGWESIDDSVIGGKSQGVMKVSLSGAAFFEGNISQYRGGFVTIRCPNGTFDLSGFAGLEIRLRGDGKAYQAMIKTDAVDTGFGYYFWFETLKGDWQTVRLAFPQFKGYFRGLNVAWAHVDPAKVVSLGFLIANWQEGPFRLEIEFIKAYK